MRGVHGVSTVDHVVVDCVFSGSGVPLAEPKDAARSWSRSQQNSQSSSRACPRMRASDCPAIPWNCLHVVVVDLEHGRRSVAGPHDHVLRNHHPSGAGAAAAGSGPRFVAVITMHKSCGVPWRTSLSTSKYRPSFEHARVDGARTPASSTAPGARSQRRDRSYGNGALRILVEPHRIHELGRRRVRAPTNTPFTSSPWLPSPVRQSETAAP